METGDSQERYLLRSSINEHLRRAIDSVKLFPGGLINSAEQVAKIRAQLISDGGHGEEEIEEHMKKHEPVGPVKANRFLTLEVKDRTLQVLRPDSDNPHWQAPRNALS